MSFHIVGVNHESSPIETRECLSAAGREAPSRALESRGWTETVVLSTCNRFEAYVAGRPPEGREPIEDLIAFVQEISGSVDTRHIYHYSGEQAVRHLFRVASGLDSLVLGETEILGQLKQAYEDAREKGRARKRTNVFFQRALFVGKAVRGRTDISRGQVSAASVGVELAKRIFGELSERSVLILGAGEMAEKTARCLRAAKVPRLTFANRTWKKAAALAEFFKAEAVPWEAFSKKLVDADIVVCSTGAAEPVVTRPMVEAAAARRGGRPLFFIDIAMPRDVEANAHDIDGVYLYDLEDLKSIVDDNFSRRSGALSEADAIIRQESEKLGVWLAALNEGRNATFRHSDLSGQRGGDRAACAAAGEDSLEISRL